MSTRYGYISHDSYPHAELICWLLYTCDIVIDSYPFISHQEYEQQGQLNKMSQIIHTMDGVLLIILVCWGMDYY